MTTTKKMTFINAQKAKHLFMPAPVEMVIDATTSIQIFVNKVLR
ncbi:hypothetical protein [Halioxenophilus aromaticivorans]